MQLRSFEDTPDRLMALGFTRHDEPSTDLRRWVRYELALDQLQSLVRLHIQVEFERTITDEPAESTVTSSYEFNGVFLAVTCGHAAGGIDRRDDEVMAVRRYPLALTTIADVQPLAVLLCPPGTVTGRARVEHHSSPLNNRASISRFRIGASKRQKSASTKRADRFWSRSVAPVWCRSSSPLVR
jgi:hypothetical protein